MSLSVVENPCGPLPMVARTCTTLPVDLISFEGGYISDSGALLTWKTASESDMQGYRVLNSADGNRFSEIGFVHSNKGRQNNLYEFKDRNSANGKWFYRLVMTGQDGKETFSTIIPVEISGPGETALTIFPNPASDVIHFSAA